MQNVALVPLKPFDGKHLNYKNFKKEFFAMYHNRIDDVVVSMIQLHGLLTDNVKAVVSETIDDHDNYDLVWQRLDEEYGYVSMQSQSKISKMLDIPSMKSANPKELITFAQQLHDSVSKLAHGVEVTELSSQDNIRFIMMKLTPHLLIQVGRKMLRCIATSVEPGRHGRLAYEKIQASAVRQVIVWRSPQRRQREFYPTTKGADN